MTLSGPATSPGGTAPSYPAKGLCATRQSSIAFTNGVAASVSVTLYNASASTLLTATDSGGSTGSTPAFVVAPASLSKLSLSAATTTPAAGAANSLTIKAIDAHGNTVTAYGGSHTLTFSGASVIGANAPTVSDLSGNLSPSDGDAGQLRIPNRERCRR